MSAHHGIIPWVQKHINFPKGKIFKKAINALTEKKVLKIMFSLEIEIFFFFRNGKVLK